MTDEEEAPQPRQKPSLWGLWMEWITRNPTIVGVSIIVGILGLPIGILVPYALEKSRDVVYSVSASPTTLVKGDQSSDLKVQYKGRDVIGDVSSIRVELWNEGMEPARRESILTKSLAVRLDPPTAILASRVTNQSRSVVNLVCPQTDAQTVSCSWDILEKGDGAVIELIYLGTSGKIAIEGSIEGDKAIRKATPSRGLLMSLATVSMFLILVPIKRFSEIEREHRLGIFGFVLYAIYALSIIGVVMLATRLVKFFWHSAPFEL